MSQAARAFALAQPWTAALAPLFDAWRERSRGRVRRPLADAGLAQPETVLTPPGVPARSMLRRRMRIARH